MMAESIVCKMLIANNFIYNIHWNNQHYPTE